MVGLPLRKLRRDGERGAAVVEFALVSVVLIPLFMSIVSIGVFLHVRNTMSMCAHEGARAGANWNSPVSDGKVYAENCITSALGSRWASGVTATTEGELVVVTMRGHFTPFGWFQALWDPTFTVRGHAVNEG